jgi:hypothetical protein
MLFSRTYVGIRSCLTLYHVDLVSSDSRVEAMFSQIVSHSAFGSMESLAQKVADVHIVCCARPLQRRKDIYRDVADLPKEKP